MYFKVLCHVTLGAMLLACAPTIKTFKPVDSASSTQRQMLIGHWYGEAQLEGGGYRQWIVERRADGTFKVQFYLVHADGQVTEQAEVGMWGASAGIYFTKTTGWLAGDDLYPANPTDAELDDVYSIEYVTEEACQIKSLAFGDVFTVKRVPPTFTLPK